MTRNNCDLRHPLGIIVTDVTPTQLAKLRALERYDISFVADRLARDKGTTSTSVGAAVIEFKRYIALAALGYRGLAVPSQEVDDLWHSFLLFTREYAAFCRKTVGRFVHHSPSRSARKLPNTAGVVKAYRRVFGLNVSPLGHCQACRSTIATA
jgi:hypothetical protein